MMIEVTRKYYRRVDDTFMRALSEALGAPLASKNRRERMEPEPRPTDNGKAEPDRKIPNKRADTT